MIRLIKRKLIIPQGDTGTFTIPLQGTLSGEGDRAIFNIYDTLTHQTKLKLDGVVSEDGDAITFTFSSKDTLGIEPDPNDQGGRYVWDVTLLRGAYIDPQTNKTVYSEVDSYYAAFSLPTCVIKRVAREVTSNV